MKSNKTKRGVGRPESKVVWPNGRFTMEQAFQLNGCYAQPARVCKLTVINHLNEDMYLIDKETGNPDKTRPNPKSVIIRLKDELGKTKSESGKGRKPYIYLRRSQRDAGRKSAANLRKAKANVSVPVVDAAPAPAVETPAIGELINS